MRIIFRSWIFYFMICFTSLALAGEVAAPNESDPKKDKSEEVTHLMSPDEIIPGKWGVGVSPVRSDGYGFSFLGIEGLYRLSSSSDFGFSHGYISSSYRTVTQDYDSRTFSLERYSLFYRRNLGKAFYLKGGASQWELKNTASCGGNCGTAMTRSFDAVSYTVDLSMGHRFWGKNFYVDFNWLGVSIPVSNATLSNQIQGSSGNANGDAYYQNKDISNFTSNVTFSVDVIFGFGF